MEHPADIRHRASLLSTYQIDIDEGWCEASHCDPDEIRWAQNTIDDLLDEIERLHRRVPLFPEVPR